MKVVFFTFVFECYQESVMFHFCPFWAKKVIGFLTVLFTKKFKNTDVSHCRVDQVRVDFQQNEM